MIKSTMLFVAALLPVLGCAPASTQNLSEINPRRVYRASVSDLMETIKSYSLREGFRLDRFGEEAGRVIAHKITSSSSGQGREFSLSTTAMMIIMNVKMARISETETDFSANFAFETGHVHVTKDEEGMLAECYITLFGLLDGQFGSPATGRPL